jgi:hypothetical protein
MQKKSNNSYYFNYSWPVIWEGNVTFMGYSTSSVIILKIAFLMFYPNHVDLACDVTHKPRCTVTMALKYDSRQWSVTQ